MPTVKRTNEEWRALLAEQRTSGQTQEEWCSANGVNLYTMRDRASRLKRMDIEATPQPKRPKRISTGWMEIKPEIVPEKAGIIIERGGFTVTVTAGIDAELLTEVLRAVSRSCS
jgi:hypothetical protein